MWVKNKGSCNFCFALKYSPVHSVKQQWWCRVDSIMMIIKKKEQKTTYIHVNSSAQILHNLRYVLRMYIFIMICLWNWITSANICLWKYEIWYCLIKSVHPLILPLSFFPVCSFAQGAWANDRLFIPVVSNPAPGELLPCMFQVSPHSNTPDSSS